MLWDNKFFKRKKIPLVAVASMLAVCFLFLLLVEISHILVADYTEEPIIDISEIEFARYVSEYADGHVQLAEYYATEGGYVALEPENSNGSFRGAVASPIPGNVFLGWININGEYLTDSVYYTPYDEDNLVFYAVFCEKNALDNDESVEHLAFLVASGDLTWRGVYPDRLSDEDVDAESLEEFSDEDAATESLEEFSDEDAATESLEELSDKDAATESSDELSDGDADTESLDELLKEDVSTESFDEDTSTESLDDLLYEDASAEPFDELSDEDTEIGYPEQSSGDDYYSDSSDNLPKSASEVIFPVEDFSDDSILPDGVTSNDNVTGSSEYVEKNDFSVNKDSDSNLAVTDTNNDLNTPDIISDDNVVQNIELPESDSISKIGHISENVDSDISALDEEELQIDIEISKPVNAKTSDDETYDSDSISTESSSVSSDDRDRKKFNVLCVKSGTNELIAYSSDQEALGGEEISLTGNIDETSYAFESVGVFDYITPEDYEDGELPGFYEAQEELVSYNPDNLSMLVKDEPDSNMSVIFYLSDIASQLSTMTNSGINLDFRPYIFLIFLGVMFRVIWRRQNGSIKS